MANSRKYIDEPNLLNQTKYSLFDHAQAMEPMFVSIARLESVFLQSLYMSTQYFLSIYVFSGRFKESLQYVYRIRVYAEPLLLTDFLACFTESLRKP